MTGALLARVPGYTFTETNRPWLAWTLANASPACTEPSVSISYKSFEDVLPEEYQGGNRCYGLGAFLKSLKKVEGLGEDVTVLPAHRAVHRGRFNPIGLERAGEIVEHHRERCYQVLELIRLGPVGMADLTRKLFSHADLSGVNFVLAYSEAMSHVEFMQECGDVTVVGGNLWQDCGHPRAHGP